MRFAPSRTDIDAIYEDDQVAALQSLGVYDAYKSGELACGVCGEPLRERGLGAAREVDGELIFACDRLDCVRTLSGPD